MSNVYLPYGLNQHIFVYTDLDPCQSFNISCEYACEVANGLPVCYCQLGHKLAADGMKCIGESVVS